MILSRPRKVAAAVAAGLLLGGGVTAVAVTPKVDGLLRQLAPIRPAAVPRLDPPGTGRLRIQPPPGLLAPGTARVTLTVTSPAAASCTVGGRPATPDPSRVRHTATAAVDPDPSVVTSVEVRCDDRPDEPVVLRYRALPPLPTRWPRTANLWGAAWVATGTDADLSRVDLWMGADDLDDAAVHRLRRLNPAVRILTSFNACEAGDGLPEAYYLHDAQGHRAEVWPGHYRLNLTRPAVSDYLAAHAYQAMTGAGLRYDGLFIDNVFVLQSWLTSDLFGRPFHADANGDGVPDDARQLDTAWRAGMVREITRIRALLPHALLVNHSLDDQDAQLAPLFDGSSLGFDVTDAKEVVPPDGQTTPTTYEDIERRYRGWTQDGQSATTVETGIPNLLAYGYGYTPQTAMPRSTLEFGRTSYGYMRFGFGVAAMRDGYFAFEVGDTWHGNPWMYDEQRVDLGPALAAPYVVAASGGGPGQVLRRDFGHGVVVLNTGNSPVTVPVGAGLRRLTGSQAPADQRIVDDGDGGFTVTGSWQPQTLDSGPLKASGPYFHNWGTGSRLGTGTASWDLGITVADRYSLSVWWPAAPSASGWSAGAHYEVVSGGKVVASATLDQRSTGDTWHSLGTVPLTPGASVRLTCPGPRPCLADAVSLASQRRYNDGSPVTALPLAAHDAAVLVPR